MPSPNDGSAVYVAGASTCIGAAVCRALERAGHGNLAAGPGQEPDPADRSAVLALFRAKRPRWVVMAAGASGGIHANQSRPADLALGNLLAASHVLEAAARHPVDKLLYLGSSCCYPRLCPQPMRPEHLWTGELEPTNRAYAAAKLAGLELTLAYRRQHGAPFVAAIPANVFGPGDDFSSEDGHVVAALVRRLHEAKVTGKPEVTVWGSGEPRRELMFADDLGDACVLLLDRFDDDRPINLGSTWELSIRELAETLREVVGFPGTLVFDRSRPDGMPRKALDSKALAALGFSPRGSLRDALAATYRSYLASLAPPLSAEVHSDA